MSDVEDDLKATAEAIRADVDRLRRIEEEKAALDADDPRVAALSEDARELARRVHSETDAESELAEEAAAEGDDGR